MTPKEREELELLKRENARLRQDNQVLQQFRRFYIIGEIRVRRALRGVQSDHQPGSAADLDR